MRITEELKEFIGRADVAKVLASAGPDGLPNIGPKATLHVFDDESLGFMEVAGGRHWENLRRDPRVSVAFLDWEGHAGYRLAGRAEIHNEGPVYEKIMRRFFKPDKPPPKACVRIRVEEAAVLRPGRPARPLTE